MTTFQKISLLLTRLSIGILFFYAGITKVMDSTWSAEGYLKGAKLFAEFYNFLLQPSVLPIVNLLNEWGLTIIGASLILGIFVRWSALAGALLMLLYYFPILDFPYPNAHSYIVDEHIAYIAALLVLSAFRAGKIWGIDSRFN
jgi:thiosulfate dehydrogenase [quinone] large subunit